MTRGLAALPSLQAKFAACAFDVRVSAARNIHELLVFVQQCSNLCTRNETIALNKDEHD